MRYRKLRRRIRKAKRSHKFTARSTAAIAIGKNPYKTKISFTFRKKVELFVLAASLLCLLSALLFHPYFHISIVEVKGLERISSDEIKTTVTGSLNFKKFLFIPGESYLIADVGEVAELLKEKYPLASVKAIKEFPNSLTIEIQEKLTRIIYDNGKNYSFVDLNGQVVEAIAQVTDSEWVIDRTSLPPETESSQEKSADEAEYEPTRVHIPAVTTIKNQFGSYPIIYDIRDKVVEVNHSVLESEQVKGIVDWFNELNDTKYGFEYATVSDSRGELVIYTKENWKLLVLTSDVDSQMTQLLQVVQNEIKNSSVEYIDLRYPGKVFWK